MSIVNVREYGNELVVQLDDGSRIMCYPTVGGMWIPTTGGSPDPGTEFKFPFPRSQHTTYPDHSGIDWPGGTVGSSANVHVIGAGVVQQVFSYSGNTYPGDSSEPVWRGNCIVIDHGTIGGHEIWSLYAHLRDTPAFSVDDAVTAGEVINRVGNTGYSDGAHLHFEIIFDGVRLQTGQGGYERTIGWMDDNASGSW